ncbi:hypothetical protein [Acetobacter fabarum]|uniref:hypothetical protein n=1 Tax=Acetobacter fabarum TaxID=483199 RepID=UPI000BA559D1|nr:hypothetical protein [Acetobacter fabarum]PEN28156.1 hypothetical protein CRM93_03785 [Acetobacter fabarum]
MSLPAPKPTGVFVRLPLSTRDIRRMDRATSRFLEAHAKPTLEGASEAALLAIGTPVAGGELEVVGYSGRVTNNYDAEKGAYTNFDLSRRLISISVSVPVGSVKDLCALVRQSEALAQIAARDAEIGRLQELLASRKRENFNAGYLIACCNIVNMHNEEGIASDILAQAGITEAEVKALDLSEYDANALAEIRKASSEDPILKCGAA